MSVSDDDPLYTATLPSKAIASKNKKSSKTPRRKAKATFEEPSASEVDLQPPTKSSRSKSKKLPATEVTEGNEEPKSQATTPKRGRKTKPSSRAKKITTVGSGEESDAPAVPPTKAPHPATKALDEERLADEVPGSGSPDELAITDEQPTPMAPPKPKKIFAIKDTRPKYVVPAVSADRAGSIDRVQPEYSQPNSTTTLNPAAQLLQAKLTPRLDAGENRVDLDTIGVVSKSAAVQTAYLSPGTNDEKPSGGQIGGDIAAPELDSSSKLLLSKSIVARDIPEPTASQVQSAIVTEKEELQEASQETGKVVSDDKSHSPVDTLSLSQQEDAANTTGITTGIFPALAHQPIEKITGCSDELLDMTVEEWIRHEIKLQYEQFNIDGEKVLESFYERAAEMRRMIEAL
jgi:hypothetical protein